MNFRSLILDPENLDFARKNKVILWKGENECGFGISTNAPKVPALYTDVRHVKEGNDDFYCVVKPINNLTDYSNDPVYVEWYNLMQWCSDNRIPNQMMFSMTVFDNHTESEVCEIPYTNKDAHKFGNVIIELL